MRRLQTLKYWLLAVPLSLMATFASAEDELIVGCNTSFLPFEFKQGDEYVGFDIDLWREIAKGLGVKWKLQPMDFGGLVPALQTKNIDVVLAGLYIKEERRKVIDYSDSYYKTGESAIVSIDNTDITDATSLKGKIVAAETGTATVSYLQSLKTVDVRQYPNIVNALLELQTGRIDAVVHDTPNLVYYANTEGKGKVKLITPPIVQGLDYGIGFQKGSRWVEPVNRELAKIRADGRYEQLHRKWFGQAPDPA